MYRSLCAHLKLSLAPYLLDSGAGSTAKGTPWNLKKLVWNGARGTYIIAERYFISIAFDKAEIIKHDIKRYFYFSFPISFSSFPETKATAYKDRDGEGRKWKIKQVSRKERKSMTESGRWSGWRGSLSFPVIWIRPCEYAVLMMCCVPRGGHDAFL